MTTIGVSVVMSSVCVTAAVAMAAARAVKKTVSSDSLFCSEIVESETGAPRLGSGQLTPFGSEAVTVFDTGSQWHSSRELRLQKYLTIAGSGAIKKRLTMVAPSRCCSGHLHYSRQSSLNCRAGLPSAFMVM